MSELIQNGRLSAKQRRRLLIDMALRRVQPGTGSSHDFMQRRTAVNDWPDLRDILRGIDWVIVGGVATRAYMPERMTRDLDILVRKRDETAVLSRLQAAGYELLQPLAIPGFLLRSPEGVELDLLLGEQAWLDEALVVPNQDPAHFPVLGLPYLTLLKLAASRAQDVADVSRMLGWATEEALAEVRHVVNRYRPDERDDLESLIFLGQQERLSDE